MTVQQDRKWVLVHRPKPGGVTRRFEGTISNRTAPATQYYYGGFAWGDRKEQAALFATQEIAADMKRLLVTGAPSFKKAFLEASEAEALS